jgi:hypothetical protein
VCAGGELVEETAEEDCWSGRNYKRQKFASQINVFGLFYRSLNKEQMKTAFASLF